jgi:hypothetical protein
MAINYIAISMTYEFAVLFWMARHFATIQNKSVNCALPLPSVVSPTNWSPEPMVSQRYGNPGWQAP